MPNHRIALAGAVVAIAALAGCGDGSTVFEAGKEFDACTLITSEDVASQFGAEFDAPEKSHRVGDKGEGTQGRCSYTSAEKAPVSMAQMTEYLQNVTRVTVTVWAWPTMAAAKTYIGSMKGFGLGHATKLTALGDEAFRIDAWEGAVHVRKGKVCLAVSVDRRALSPEEDKAIELKLTKLALSRL